MFLGVLLLGGAVLFGGLRHREEQQAAAACAALVQEARSVPVVLTETAGPAQTAEPLTALTLPEGVCAILTIPRLDRELPVWADYSDAALKQTVCRYGQDRCGADRLVIAGHNTKPHFRGLDTLAAGDAVTLEDEGGLRTYTVTGSEIIAGTDPEALFAGEWDLSLFTCAADRTRRVVIRCDETTDVSDITA